jgi:hypothetical protein
VDNAGQAGGYSSRTTSIPESLNDFSRPWNKNTPKTQPARKENPTQNLAKQLKTTKVRTGRPRWGGSSRHVIMERSCTRGTNILASLCCFLGLTTEVTKRLMDNIFWVADIGDSLNHVHKIWGIGEILHGIVHCPPQLIPNEIKDAKPLFIRCHPIKEIGSIVP